MSDTSQGRSSLFGRSVPEILQAMRNTRFKDEVIGPLGMHIKIAVSTYVVRSYVFFVDFLRSYTIYGFMTHF
jgi:hypothetical protein